MKDIYISDGPVEVKLNDDFSSLQNNPEQLPKPQKQQKPKKKKHHFFKRFLCIIAALLILITAVISLTAVASGYTHDNLDKNEYISSTSLQNNPFITNILLIGTDDASGGTSRSDTMLMLSLDFVHRKIKLTSFLRDCWVEIPSTGKQMKINSACVYGGAQLVCDTIEYNFHIDIDHYLKVNFEMFTTIIDKIGGIDVEVTQKEAEFINNTTRYTISSGSSVHLSGAEALVYVRIRKLDSDYMRTYRQRKVVSALLKKLTRTSPVDLLSTVKEVMPLMETDLNPIEISGLAYKSVIAAGMFDIQQIRIPDDDMMTTGYVGSQWAEIPDLDACRKGLYDFIYTDYKSDDES